VALRRVVKLREAHAIRREPIEVWCVDLAAVAAEIGEAHVIHHDQQEVRLGREERRAEGEEE